MSSKKILIICLALLFVLTVGFLVWKFVFQDNEISIWETYENEDLEYQVKYPNYMTFDDKELYWTFPSPDSANDTVLGAIYVNRDDATADSNFMQNASTDESCSRQKTNEGYEQIICRKEEGSLMIYTYVLGETGTYRIVLNVAKVIIPGKKMDLSEQEKIYSDMVSTFKVMPRGNVVISTKAIANAIGNAIEAGYIKAVNTENGNNYESSEYVANGSSPESFEIKVPEAEYNFYAFVWANGTPVSYAACDSSKHLLSVAVKGGKTVSNINRWCAIDQLTSFVDCKREEGGVTCGAQFYKDFCQSSYGGATYLIKKKCDMATGTVCLSIGGIDGIVSDEEKVYCEHSCDFDNGVCKAGLAVLEPRPGTQWKVGNTETIKWDVYGYDYAKIELIKNGVIVEKIASDIPATPTTYYWKIPSDLVPANDYRIKITPTNQPGIYDDEKGDFCDNYFVILPTSGALTSSLKISGVEGLETNYENGCKVNFKVFAEKSDMTPAKASEGFRVRAYILNEDLTATIFQKDAVFNNYYWEISLNMPTQGNQLYNLKFSVYCDSGCVAGYTGKRADLTKKIMLSSEKPLDIDVISPNGGEILHLNTVNNVKSECYGLYELSYYLYKGNEKLGLLDGIVIDEDTFKWNVGKYKNAQGSIITTPAGQDYRIALFLPMQNTPVDLSDSFFNISQ